MDDFIPYAHAILSTTPLRWLSLTTTLPRDLLERKPAASEWSALECLRHLLISERNLPVWMRNFLTGEGLEHVDEEEEDTPHVGRAPSELAAAYAELRRDNLALLSTLTPADLQRTVPAGDTGRITLEETLHLWVAHDLEHTVQAERSFMQPFIAGSGIWRPSLADHDAERPASRPTSDASAAGRL